MLDKKRGLQTTPPQHTHTHTHYTQGETSKGDREEGRERKEHAVGNQPNGKHAARRRERGADISQMRHEDWI